MTSNYNILLVDHDAWSLCNLENIIAKREDMTIFKAGNGLAALKILEKERIDFLVTDLLMPGMDGMALMKEGQVVQPGLITVIQSVVHELNTAIDAIKRGAFDYVTKPIFPPHLLLTLDKCIEKKIQEQKLAEQSEKLKLLTTTIDQSTVSIVITDRDGCTQYVNPHFCELTGYTVEEAIGENPRILKSGDTPPEFYKDMWETILAGKVWKGEIKNRKKNGELLWERATISPVYNVQGDSNNRTGAGKERDLCPPGAPVVGVPGLITNFIAIKEDITYEKQLVEALHKAEALQRAIFNSANFSSIATDAKGVIQIFNVGAERMLGYTASEVMNTITPADISDPQEVIARAEALSIELGMPITPGFEALAFKASRGIEDIYELTYIRKDGSRFPAVVSVTALCDEQEAIIGYLLIGTDNTVRKQNEAALRDSNSFNIAILNSLSAQIAVLDSDGVITAVNESWRRFALGNSLDPGQLPPHTEIGTNYLAVCQSHDSGIAAYEGIQSVLAGKVSNFSMEYPCQSPDEERWFIMNVSSLGKDCRQGVVVAHTNITVRKQAEEDNKRKSAVIASLLDSIPDLIFFKDLQGMYLGCNPPFAEFVGRSKDEIVGKTDYDLFGQEVADFFREQDDLMMKGGESRRNEEWITYPDGRRILVDTLKAPFCNSEGVLIGLLGISRDVTREYAAQQTLRDNAAEIQTMNMSLAKRVEDIVTELRQKDQQLLQAQKLEAIGQLAAGIAHEINSPMQYVQNNVTFFAQAFDTLKKLFDEVGKTEKSLLTAETAALLATINLEFLLQEIPESIKETLEGINRVVEIVSAMKEFSHPGSNDKVSADLNRALSSTITVCSNEWKYAAEVITDFDPDLPLVPCFPNQLNQVVLNLIVNAAHAIEDHNAEAPSTLGCITITTRQDGDWVEILVRDSGGGIPEEIQHLIFDPFFTTKKIGKGTGQGLAIAHDIVVNLHGGQIDLRTLPGQGTTFLIRLPITPLRQCETPGQESI